MITLLYSDTKIIADQEFSFYLMQLPVSMQVEVMRYKNDSDRKGRLLARLMLLDTLKQFGKEELITKWDIHKYKKPFIEEWMEFNISHSGNLVLFAYGEQELGVDIEQKNELNYQDIMGCLHSKEQQAIVSSDNPHQTFYDIWVRKEALMKAMGIGITSGDRYCAIDTVYHDQLGKWILHPIEIHHDYASCICVKNTIEKLVITEYKPLKMEVQ